MKASSNTLRLRWREWGTVEEKICILCRDGIESLEHFMLECVALEYVRSRYSELVRPRMGNNEQLMVKILMFIESDRAPIYHVDLVWELWRERKRLIEMQSPSVNV